MGGRGAEAWGWTAEGDYREIKKGMWDLIHCYTAVLSVSTHWEKAKKRQAFLPTDHRPGATDAILLPSGLNQTLNSPSTLIHSGPSAPRTSTTSTHPPSSPSTLCSTAPTSKLCNKHSVTFTYSIMTTSAFLFSWAVQEQSNQQQSNMVLMSAR